MYEYLNMFMHHIEKYTKTQKRSDTAHCQSGKHRFFFCFFIFQIIIEVPDGIALDHDGPKLKSHFTRQYQRTHPDYIPRVFIPLATQII